VYTAVFANKIGMTQVFKETGEVTPVTLIKIEPSKITQIKNNVTDGYTAIQVGAYSAPITKVKKPNIGHLKKSGQTNLTCLKEYKIDNETELSLGHVFSIKDFSIGETVDISGYTVGKGFSGNQKRHNFSRGPMSHGSKSHRAPGSIGAGTTPGRVLPGKKMAGQMGNKRVTLKKVEILGINEEKNFLIVRGCIPGKPGNRLFITKS